MFETPFRFWVHLFIGFFVWDNLTGTAQVLVIPAANDGGIYLLNRMTEPLLRCEATETFCASWPRITAVLLFPATKSTDASSSASRKGCWESLHHFSGNESTAAVNMFETPFRFWVHLLIGFFVWDNLTGTAQVLVIPAANDGGIYPLNRMTEPLLRCEATETFCASWPRITAVLLFPATKSTDASSSASRKGCWESLHHFSGNGGTAAVNMFEIPFRFWVQLIAGVVELALAAAEFVLAAAEFALAAAEFNLAAAEFNLAAAEFDWAVAELAMAAAKVQVA
ncbi:hypothetical protein MTO96_028607 [Rhipicephalus appendiculatus]